MCFNWNPLRLSTSGTESFRQGRGSGSTTYGQSGGSRGASEGFPLTWTSARSQPRGASGLWLHSAFTLIIAPEIEHCRLTVLSRWQWVPAQTHPYYPPAPWVADSKCSRTAQRIPGDSKWRSNLGMGSDKFSGRAPSCRGSDSHEEGQR